MPNQGRAGSVLSRTQCSGVAGPRNKPPVGPMGQLRPSPARGPVYPGPTSHGTPSSNYNGGANKGDRRPFSAAGSAFSGMSRTPAAFLPTIDENATQMAEQFSRLQVGAPSGQAERTYDPSNAPSPSQITAMTEAFSTVSSKASSRSRRIPVKNQFCTLTTCSKRDFKKGDIFTLPHHVVNCNPNVDLTDPNLTLTKFGGVYSKRRMFIVLTTSAETMLCIPMFTYSKTGMKNKPPYIRNEFCAIANVGDTGFVNQTPNPTVRAQCKRPLDKNSLVHLGDVVKVGYREDIVKVGHVMPASYNTLLEQWRNLIEESI